MPCLCLISLGHGEFLQSCTVLHIDEACVALCDATFMHFWATNEIIAALFLCFVNCHFLQSSVLIAFTFYFNLFFCGVSQTWLCFEVEGKSF